MGCREMSGKRENGRKEIQYREGGRKEEEWKEVDTVLYREGGAVTSP